MIVFQYHPSILAQFPTIRGGIALVRNLTNAPTLDALAARYASEQQAVLARIGDTPLAEIESLSAWRRTFSAFGVPPTKYRNAAEALLRRLTKHGDIPNVNILVDIGNVLSIRYALPIAFVDRRHMTGTLTVQFADGDERFTDLGQSEVMHPEPGEVIFADEQDLIFARRWCWRQSDHSASRLDTTEAIVTIEGIHADAERDVRAALDDLRALLTEFVPGVVIDADLLSPEKPALVVDTAG